MTDNKHLLSGIGSINVLSLFDGISCGMVALERVGIPVKRYVAFEIDQYALQVMKLIGSNIQIIIMRCDSVFCI